MACLKCGQPYVLAALGERVVWMAVAPFARSLCAGSCQIDAGRGRP
jgi:hypothetical protein